MSDGVPGTVAVSVVVPVKDDAAGLLVLLLALAGQTWTDHEVVVVDNASRSASVRDVAQRHGARYVREPAPGSYAARNAGVRVARGDVVAFTDADCVPSRQWLATAVAALRDPRAPDVLAGRVRVTVRRPGRPAPSEAWELVHGFQQEAYVRRAGWGATANLVVPRRVLDAVGPFDERLRSGGDAEWGARATAAGFRVAYADDVVVDHPARPTMGELRSKLRRVQRGAYRQAQIKGQPVPSPLAAALLPFRPPLGAVGRARHHPLLDSARAEAAYVVAEWSVRTHAVLVRGSEARRARRRGTT